MPKLVIRDAQGNEREHELVHDVTTIGRGSGNIIQTKDREASRQHCRIEKTPDGYRLVDNRSRNGTFLNGARVDVQMLKPGDEIRIGEFRIFFDPPPRPAGTPATSEDFAATVEVAPLDEKSLGPAPGKPKYVLEVIEGRDKGKVIELPEGTFTIGRHSSNKYPIDDEAASNYHAEITKEPTGYFITDLGSTNGTRVGGEKIVKTRLSNGAEIQIGTTKMIFKNIGGKAEEEEVFGTVVLDTERLERELAEDEARARARFLKYLALAASVVILAGVGVAVWLSRSGETGPAVEGNLLPNPSFDEGVSAKGDPEGWESHGGRFTPWQVVTGTDRLAKKTRASALMVSRESGAAPGEYAECSTTFELSTGNLYRFGGWLKAQDARGVYGFRIRWLGNSGQESLEQVYVMGSQPDWRQLSRVVAPPRWAKRARFACFAYGDRGKVYFDDVYLTAEKPTPGGPAPSYEVAYDRIRVEGSGVGFLDVKSGGILAARGGQLFMAASQDSESTQELADADPPLVDKTGVVFKGVIPELENYDLVRYTERIKPGESSVSVEYELRSEKSIALMRSGVRFTIGPEFGASAAQAYDSNGDPVELGSEPQKNIREIVFTSADGEKLSIGLRGEGFSLSLEPVGDEKLLEISMDRATIGNRPFRFGLEFGIASKFERKELESALKALKEARETKDASAEYSALERIVALGQRFPKEAEQAKRDSEQLMKRFREELEAVRSILGQLKVSAEGEARSALEAQFNTRLGELKARYPREPFAADLDRLERERAEVLENLARAAKEKLAQAVYDKILDAIKEERLAFAKAYLKTLTTEYGETEVARKAQERGLPSLVDGLERRLADRDAAFVRLERRVRMWETAGMTQEAIRLLDSDADYIRYKDDPKDSRFRELRARLLKKLETPPPPAQNPK